LSYIGGKKSLAAIANKAGFVAEFPKLNFLKANCTITTTPLAVCAQLHFKNRNNLWKYKNKCMASKKLNHSWKASTA
jgi:hypothetical protein